jgi:hypothetical protein
MTDRKDNLARRTLLGGAVTAGAALGVASLIKGRGPVEPETTKTAVATTPEPQGYRLTEHVRRYYATARV